MLSTTLTWLPILALAASFYAPLGGRAQHDLERLAAVSSLPAAKQPYPVELVEESRNEIEFTHPRLYRRLNHAFHRDAEFTIAGAVHEQGEDFPVRAYPNEHGRTVNGAAAVGGALFLRPAAGLAASLGADFARHGDDYELHFSNTYLSAGFPFLRLDLGLRDHWYSPAASGAIAMSTHAVNPVSITLANTRPLTRARVMYEVFLARLAETDSIYVSGQPRTGHPSLLGLHLSFAPASWLTLAGNRMLQFGGEPRPSLSVWDVIRGLVDPNRYDNVSGELSRDNEVGNQIGSIAVAANYSLGRFPLRFYWELGADDTGSGRWYYFGNPLTIVGLFAPFVTEELSLRYEFVAGQNRWYEHSIYREGYRNEDRVLGHWIYDFNTLGFEHEIEADLHAVTAVWTTELIEAAITARRLSVDLLRVIRVPGSPLPPSIAYSDGWEIDLDLRRQVSDHLDARLRLFTGRTPIDQSFTNLSLGVSVQ